MNCEDRKGIELIEWMIELQPDDVDSEWLRDLCYDVENDRLKTSYKVTLSLKGYIRALLASDKIDAEVGYSFINLVQDFEELLVSKKAHEDNHENGFWPGREKMAVGLEKWDGSRLVRDAVRRLKVSN